MMTPLLAAVGEIAIERLLVGLVVVLALAFTAYYGLRHFEQPLWASRVAAVVLVVGVVILLLVLL